MKTILGRLAAAFGLTALLATGVAAQDASYPSRPITLVVPFSAGGGNDATARLYAKQLEEVVKQPVLVENRPGAGGQIGASSVLKADADGYTLLWASTSVAVVTPVQEDWPFDMTSEFRAVSLLSGFNLVLAVPGNSEIKTLEQLIAQTRDSSKRTTFGSAGIGTTQNLAAMVFEETVGGSTVAIQYKGSADALQDTLGGRLTYVFDTVANVKPYVENGQLTALAILADARSEGLPDVPTIAEAGLPDMLQKANWDFWYGALASARTPDDIVAKLRTALVEANNSEAVRKALTNLSLRKLPDRDPEEADKIIEQSVAAFRPLLKSAK